MQLYNNRDASTYNVLASVANTIGDALQSHGKMTLLRSQSRVPGHASNRRLSSGLSFMNRTGGEGCQASCMILPDVRDPALDQHGPRG